MAKAKGLATGGIVKPSNTLIGEFTSEQTMRIKEGSGMDKELKKMVAKEIAEMAVEESQAAPAILGPDGGLLADAPKNEKTAVPTVTTFFDLAGALAKNLGPDFFGDDYVLPPGVVSFLAEGGEDIDYPYTITINAPNTLTMDYHVNAAIRAGQVSLEYDGLEIYLHAVQGHRFMKYEASQNKYKVNLTYIFRVRPIRKTKEA